MKIHIDTSSAKAKTEKLPSKSQGSATGKTASGKKSTSSQPQSPTSTSPPSPKPNLPKSPPKEPKAPNDVAQARKQQTNVLQQRQLRETQGKSTSMNRDIDAGAGFWPPLSPLL